MSYTHFCNDDYSSKTNIYVKLETWIQVFKYSTIQLSKSWWKGIAPGEGAAKAWSEGITSVEGAAKAWSEGMAPGEGAAKAWSEGIAPVEDAAKAWSGDSWMLE